MKGTGLDMYRKVAPDLVVATFRGGIFSLIAVALMGCLAFVETWAFVGAGDIRETIDVELGVSPARINIEVEFPSLNCDDATVELWRGKSSASIPMLRRTVLMTRFDNATKRSYPYRKIAKGAKKVDNEVDDFMGCKLQGHLTYEHTSPGTVAILAPAGSDLSHYVVEFTFGMPLTRDQERALKSLPERYSKVVASTLQRIRYESPSRDKIFNHFVHVVPTKYQLAKWKGFTAFQLLHQSHLSHMDGAQEEAVTRFGFDISPMTALVSNRSAKRWYDFVTSLLSIIGGAFTVVSLLERGAAALGG